MKVLNVQGRKKTGKTTTVTNIISELCRRGYSVGSIKAIHIDGFTMDVETEDTGKHKKAGADPVTARCHDETNIMYKGKKSFGEILEHYDNDWIVIESHVDLKCPNLITGRTMDMLDDRVDELTIGCSGVISNEGITEYETPDGRLLPVINSVTDIEKLVDLIEEKTEDYVPGERGARPIDQYGKTHEKTAPKSGAEAKDINIIMPNKDFPLLETNEYRKVSGGSGEETGSDTMLTENNINVYVNEIRIGSIPHTPENIAELVLGWAQAEGYFDKISEVEEVEINGDASIARLSIPPRTKSPYELRKDIRKVTPIEWKDEWIFELAEDFENLLPLRKETMAAHNCRIAEVNGNDIEILFRCEDIGRHSAIDKVNGWALLNNIDMKNCVLFTSGRISRAMVMKVIRAGIPVMAGKGTISKKAVELAKEYDLTLIGYAKKDGFSIFTEPDQD